MAKGYSVVEKAAARFLERAPRLKRRIKRCYQGVQYVINRKGTPYITDMRLERISCDGRESFFGYYDKCPANSTNDKIVFHSTQADTSGIPDPDRPVDIVVFDRIKDVFVKVGTSRAYNWQQGSRLQWISNEEIVFNRYDEAGQVLTAEIYDIARGTVRTGLDMPVYDCFKDFALTLNFARLDILRPDYGYRNYRQQGLRESDLPSYQDDGLFLLNTVNGGSTLIVSIQQAVELHYNPLMKDARHYFNHIMISPDGLKCVFLHRWIAGGRRFDALLSCNIDGTDLFCVVDTGMVSHFCWYDASSLIAYLRQPESGDRFYRVSIPDGDCRILGPETVGKMGDGHPSFQNGRLLLDSYPDKSRMKSLYIYDPPGDCLAPFGEFLEPWCYDGETRCDLHPRWGAGGNDVYFDSVHDGRRYLYRGTFQ